MDEKREELTAIMEDFEQLILLLEEAQSWRCHTLTGMLRARVSRYAESHINALPPDKGKSMGYAVS